MGKSKVSKSVKKNLKENQKLMNLKEVAELLIQNPKNQKLRVNVVGVVVGKTEPVKVQNKNMYFTRVKIIDDTFNYKVQMKSKEIKFHKYSVVNFYSNN